MSSKEKKSEKLADVEINSSTIAHMSLFSGVAMIVGLIIGSGIFATAGPAFEVTNSVGMTLIFWVLAGVLSTFGGLCYVELGCMIPKNGGEHNYLLMAFGPYIAYSFDWTQSLLSLPLCGSLIALVFSKYLCSLAYVDPSLPPDLQRAPPEILVKPVAIGLIMFIAGLNMISARIGSKISNVMMIIKISSLGFVVGLGMYWLAKGNVENFATPFDGYSKNPLSYASALYNQLFAFGGWNNLNYLLSELKNPTRNLPLAISISMGVVISVYLLTNIAYFAVVPPSVLAHTQVIATEVGFRVLGYAGCVIVPIMVMFSTIGAVNAITFANSRLIAASAQEGIIFPKFLSRFHQSRNTPIFTIIITAVLSSLYTIPGDFGLLMTVYSFVTWLFYCVTIAGLIRLRYTRPDLPRPFRVFTPLAYIFCLVTFGLTLYPLLDAKNLVDAIPFIVSIVIMLIPLPIVYSRSKRQIQ